MKKFIMVVVACLIATVSVNAESTNNETYRSFHNLGIATKDNCDWQKKNTEIVFTESWMNLENSDEITTFLFDAYLGTKVKVRGNNTYKIASYKVSPTMDILGHKITAEKVTRVMVYSQEGNYLREWYEVYESDGVRKIYK